MFCRRVTYYSRCFFSWLLLLLLLLLTLQSVAKKRAEEAAKDAFSGTGCVTGPSAVLSDDENEDDGNGDDGDCSSGSVELVDGST